MLREKFHLVLENFDIADTRIKELACYILWMVNDKEAISDRWSATFEANLGQHHIGEELTIILYMKETGPLNGIDQILGSVCLWYSKDSVRDQHWNLEDALWKKDLTGKELNGFRCSCSAVSN